MKHTKGIALSAAAISLAALFLGVGTLFLRIRDFNASHPPSVFLMQEVANENFIYADRDVSIQPTLDSLGRGTITLTYGSDSTTFPIGIPTDLPIPGLARFHDWMRILRFVETDASQSHDKVLNQVEQGSIQDRLVIAARTPRPGDNEGLLGIKVDPDAWGFGEVMRKNWIFDFYELKPNGGIEHQTLRFPTTRYREEQVQGELQRNTWQYDAALRIMPKGSAPKPDFSEAALVQAGWPFKLAGASSMTLLISLLVAFAPTRADRVPGSPATPEQLAAVNARRA